MIRVLVSAAATLFLLSGYFLYSAIMTPLTIARTPRDPLPTTHDSDYRPPLLTSAASEYFPDVAWIHSDQLETFESQEQKLVLFTQRTERVTGNGQSQQGDGEGRTLKMAPLAVMIKDPRQPDRQPFRIIAESGLVQFQNSFFDEALDLSSSKPGRIVWASLDGAVQIDGPEGLQIDGSSFFLSERDHQLYSDQSVTFHFGPTAEDQTEVTGSGDSINLQLILSSESAIGRDLPRLSGMQSLTLRKNVTIQTSFIHEGSQQHAQIQCAGPFAYDFLKRTAAFESDVRLTHLTPKSGTFLKENLLCEYLAIHLDRATPLSAEEEHDPTKLLDDLIFRELRASGTPTLFGGRTSNVRLVSEQHGIEATMRQLVYNAINRVATMTDERGVVLKREDTTFRCPEIDVEHTEDNSGIVRVNAIGAGQITIAGKHFPKEPAQATWQERLEVAPDPATGVHVASLIGDADFTLPESNLKTRSTGVGVAADQLQLWIDLEKIDETANVEDVMKAPLPVSRAQATGSVKLVSENLIVEDSDSINLRISQADLTRPADTTKSRSGLFDGPQRNGQTKRPPVWVAARTMQVDLEHDPRLGSMRLKQVDGRGEIELKHQPAPNATLNRLGSDNPFVFHGVRLVGGEDEQGDHFVTLLGQVDDRGEVTHPAQMNFGATQIGGANLTFREQDNSVAIIGPGKFRVPISKDLEGNELNIPATMEVGWQEQMTFDGKTARFLSSVRCSFDNHQESRSYLNCEDMIVVLNQKIEFDQGSEQSSDIQVDEITARHLVSFEAHEFQAIPGEPTKLIGIRKGNLDRVDLNQKTGKFTGTGPGTFQFWSYGNSRDLAPSDRAAANRPLKADDQKSWQYATISFNGSIEGDMNRRTAVLADQRIEILSAPVEQPLLTFHRGQLSVQPKEPPHLTKAAENAAWMGCRNLQIVQRKYAGQNYWELFAKESVELEGRIFRAVADELSFDERAGKFMLRGIGKKALIYYQKSLHDSPRSTEAQLIEFVPKESRITIDGASGASN